MKTSRTFQSSTCVCWFFVIHYLSDCSTVKDMVIVLSYIQEYTKVQNLRSITLLELASFFEKYIPVLPSVIVLLYDLFDLFGVNLFLVKGKKKNLLKR